MRIKHVDDSKSKGIFSESSFQTKPNWSGNHMKCYLQCALIFWSPLEQVSFSLFDVSQAVDDGAMKRFAPMEEEIVNPFKWWCVKCNTIYEQEIDGNHVQ